MVTHQPTLAGADPRLAEEFRRDPFGRHSPELQRILHVMRGPPIRGKHVLLCTKPHREWALGRLSGAAEEPIELVPGRVFTSLAEAEWHVFKLHWAALTGQSRDDGPEGDAPEGGGPDGDSPRRDAPQGGASPEGRRMIALSGYADRISVRPREPVAFQVSAEDEAPYRADIVRLRCGDLNP